MAADRGDLWGFFALSNQFFYKSKTAPKIKSVNKNLKIYNLGAGNGWILLNNWLLNEF